MRSACSLVSPARGRALATADVQLGKPTGFALLLEDVHGLTSSSVALDIALDGLLNNAGLLPALVPARIAERLHEPAG